jgi:hypothetical protein
VKTDDEGHHTLNACLLKDAQHRNVAVSALDKLGIAGTLSPGFPHMVLFGASPRATGYAKYALANMGTESTLTTGLDEEAYFLLGLQSRERQPIERSISVATPGENYSQATLVNFLHRANDDMQKAGFVAIVTIHMARKSLKFLLIDDDSGKEGSSAIPQARKRFLGKSVTHWALEAQRPVTEVETCEIFPDVCDAKGPCAKTSTARRSTSSPKTCTSKPSARPPT